MKHALFLLRRLPAYDRGYLPRVAALAVLAGLTPLLGIVFPKLIFDELLGLRRVPWLMLWVALLAGGGWLFAMAKAWLTKGRDAGNERTFIGLQQELYQKADRLSLEKSERKSTLDLVERSTYGQYALYELMQTLEPLGGAALSLILSFGILISGDGWLLLILTAMSLLAIPSARRLTWLEADNARRSASDNRSFGYFANIAIDFRYGKDIRLTGGRGLMLRRARQTMDSIMRINHEYFSKSGFWLGLSAALVELQTSLAFGLLAVRLFAGNLSVGDFVLLYGAARQYCAAGRQLIELGTRATAANLEIEPLVAYMGLEEQQDAGNPADIQVQRALAEARAGRVEIEGKDLWFQYPSGEAPVLKGCSFHIAAGQTLALVGRNGAGKSTLVKLLCRFYEPDQGQILLNGVDIRRIPLQEYHSVLACTFQDFGLLPVRVDENICCKAAESMTEVDRAAMRSAVERLELATWLQQQPKQEATFYSRELDEQGVLPSGGQAQKIALARALCHGGTFLMMDEPTAALDPRAEEEVFRVMLHAAREMTALFISHRLSSTRYADRILVMEDGRIAQEGSHGQLMTGQGLYALMYRTQAAQYARTGQEKRED